MNSGKPSFTLGNYGNPEPSPDEKSGKVQRLGEYTISARSRRKVGYEIVHAFRKLRDKCKRKVTGSNPVRGARNYFWSANWLAKFMKYVSTSLTGM